MNNMKATLCTLYEFAASSLASKNMGSLHVNPTLNLFKESFFQLSKGIVILCPLNDNLISLGVRFQLFIVFYSPLFSSLLLVMKTINNLTGSCGYYGRIRRLWASIISSWEIDQGKFMFTLCHTDVGRNSSLTNILKIIWFIFPLKSLVSNVQERPNNADVYRLLGDVKFELKDYDGSASAYKNSLSVSTSLSIITKMSYGSWNCSRNNLYALYFFQHLSI